MAGVYGSHVAKSYDALYTSAASHYDVTVEAAHVLTRARAVLGGRPVASLLDVACGTGAHLASWHRTIDDVAGVDLSADMLERARARLGDAVPLTVADFTTMDLGRTFDVVTCLFSSIGYVRDLDQLDAAVAAMGRHVAPGGALLVEPWITPDDWLGERMSVESVEDEDGASVARVLQTLRDGDVVEMDWMMVAKGVDGLDVARERHRTLLVTRERYLDAFTAAGLDATWEDPGIAARARGLIVGRSAGPR